MGFRGFAKLGRNTHQEYNLIEIQNQLWEGVAKVVDMRVSLEKMLMNK